MDYILEEVDASGKKVTKNVLVQQNRITYISDRPLRMEYTRVTLQNFQLLPALVMADCSLYQNAKDGTLLQALDELVKKGCTTVITAFPMYYEREFEVGLDYIRDMLKISYLDYCIGLSIPIHKLTPSIIRMCQRKKLPFIMLEIEHPEEINNIVWEWIRDANFPFEVQLIPNWDKLKLEGKRKKHLIGHFHKLTNQKDIAVVTDYPGEKRPLGLNILKQLGIYPQKGDFVRNGELDYILYLDSSTDKEKFKRKVIDHLDEKEPAIVVKDGVVIKAGDNLFAETGQGKEITIKRPGIFKSIF
jgi:hypothetical protein